MVEFVDIEGYLVMQFLYSTTFITDENGWIAVGLTNRLGITTLNGELGFRSRG